MRSRALASMLLAACGAPATGELDETAAASSSTTTGPEGPTSGTMTETGEATTGALAPACCGCLCVDPERSCGANTCTPEGGGPAPLAVEAGFIEVAAHPIAVHTGDEVLAVTAPASRLWYAFRPAEGEGERPLAVFFNGGPGYSTAVLFGTNTGAWTFDPAVTQGAPIAENPHAWTQFAHLLYVDPPETGYSYDLEAAEAPPLPFIPEHDAATVAWFLLKFLAGHPQIRGAPVLFVGQSWGGVRASLIGHHLLFARGLVDGPVYRNAGLYAAIEEHLAAVQPGPTLEDPATAARQFGWRVLIQPVISTGLEYDTVLPRTPYEQVDALRGCVEGHDPYQCDQPGGWTLDHNAAVVAGVVRPDALSHALGLDIRSIAWMHAEARAKARRRAPMEGYGAEDEDALRAWFGELPADDHYYLRHFVRPGLPEAFYAAHPGYGRRFVETLPYVRTFVTDAGKDSLVYGPDLAAQIAHYADLVVAASVETGGDGPRPGRIRVTFGDAAIGERSVRFPFYAGAGHTVTARAPGELLADVAAWYAEE